MTRSRNATTEFNLDKTPINIKFVESLQQESLDELKILESESKDSTTIRQNLMSTNTFLLYAIGEGPFNSLENTFEDLCKKYNLSVTSENYKVFQRGIDWAVMEWVEIAAPYLLSLSLKVEESTLSEFLGFYFAEYPRMIKNSIAEKLLKKYKELLHGCLRVTISQSPTGWQKFDADLRTIFSTNDIYRFYNGWDDPNAVGMQTDDRKHMAIVYSYSSSSERKYDTLSYEMQPELEDILLKIFNLLASVEGRGFAVAYGKGYHFQNGTLTTYE